MRLRQLNIGCFGGGTGLPSLLGGLKRNPWLRLNAIVTTFDSGGSSGQLRDELGVLPPGDVLRCALALARKQGEKFDIMSTSFFLNRRTFRPSKHQGLPSWQESLFITMTKSAANATDFYRLPTNRVIELGQQIII